MADVQEELPEERYSFSRAGHLSPEQLRALHLIQEQFVRNLSHTMSAWLRTQFLVTAEPADQKNFSAFTATVPEVSYVCSLRLEPIGAHACLHLDLALALPMVDVLLGGNGSSGGVRELTEIEEAILFSVTGMILREWEKSWPASTLHFALDKREREGQLQRLMLPTEKTVCISVQIAMPETTGRLTLCLPAVTLSAVLRKLITQRDRPRRRSSEWRLRLEQRLLSAEFPAILRFPAMRLSARTLAGLQVGQMLPLPLARNADAVFHLGAAELFQAQPVRAGEHRAARLLARSTSSAPALLAPVEENETWN